MMISASNLGTCTMGQLMKLCDGEFSDAAFVFMVSCAAEWYRQQRLGQCWYVTDILAVNPNSNMDDWTVNVQRVAKQSEGVDTPQLRQKIFISETVQTKVTFK